MDSGIQKAVLIQAFAAYGADCSYAVDTAVQMPATYASVAFVSSDDPDPSTRLEEWLERGASGLRIISTGSPDRNVTAAGNEAGDRLFGGINAAASLELLTLARDRQIPVVLTMPRLLTDDMPRLQPVLERFRDITCIIDHGGFPSADQLRQDWDTGPIGGLFKLAAYPNVLVKITSIPLQACRRAGAETAARFAERLVDTFGSERLMWGSNWPTTPYWDDDTSATYRDLVGMVLDACKGLPESDRENIMGRTAARIWPQLAKVR